MTCAQPVGERPVSIQPPLACAHRRAIDSPNPLDPRSLRPRIPAPSGNPGPASLTVSSVSPDRLDNRGVNALAPPDGSGGLTAPPGLKTALDRAGLAVEPGLSPRIAALGGPPLPNPGSNSNAEQWRTVLREGKPLLIPLSRESLLLCAQ